jgi:hypothetical protein
MDNLIERVARFADIDTRRALGVTPGRLPKTDFVPWPIAPTTFRYFPALRKLLYINFDESYDVYTWEVYEDIRHVNDNEWGPVWSQVPPGKHRGVWRGLDDFIYFDNPTFKIQFQFAGQPVIISD